MKKFMIKLLLAVLLVLTGQGIFWFCIIEQNIQIGNLAEEVYGAIEIAETKNTYAEVIIGDSVCRQLFLPEYQEENEDVCYMGTNQLITACGNYILLEKYIANNPQTKKVYYFIRPQSLAKDMDERLFYPYFVIPFCQQENMKYMEEETKKLLVEKFGYTFVYNRYVKQLLLSNKAPLNIYLKQYSNENESEANSMSEVSIVYLKRIVSLCNENDIELVMIATPLAGDENNYDWNIFRKEIEKYGFENIMADYLNHIIYIPNEYFTDGVHLQSDYVKENREKIIKEIFGTFPIQ